MFFLGTFRILDFQNSFVLCRKEEIFYIVQWLYSNRKSPFSILRVQLLLIWCGRE